MLQDEDVTVIDEPSARDRIVLTLPSGATVTFSRETPPEQLREHVRALGLDDPFSPYLTTKKAARYLQISERNVHRLVEECQLPVDRIGRKLIFHRARLDAWVDSQSGRDLP